MALDPVIFREYDIRGVYNAQFDSAFAYDLGRAYISALYKKTGKKDLKISIGNDARLSSPEIVKALAEGASSSGAHVLLLGLVTSPISYFSTFVVNGVDGALMVTGSHNPPEYNGFKISIGNKTIFGEEIKNLYKIIQAKDFILGTGKIESFDIFPLYLERYKKEFSHLSPIPVVLDCGNGAAGCIVRKLYEAVGLKPLVLFEQPDGRFPNHHPDPTVAENLVELIRTVRETGARVGIGFDGDADRIGIVDEKGDILYGDEFIALVSRFILKGRPGEKIIGDVKCSDRMFSYVAKYGGEPIMWKTGHSLIKEKIKSEKAPFGGELSGHIFFNDRNYGYDDALYAGLRLIEILSQTGKTIRELLADLPPSFSTPEIRIETTEEKKHSIVRALQEKFSSPSADYSINQIDGIRVSFKDGWALARASNTQPVLVLRFESSSESGLNKIRAEFDRVVAPLL